MLFKAKLGKVVSLCASALLVISSIILILLLISSAAYLHGIYDGIGQAGVVLAIVAALLTFEVIGLLPALQLSYMWRRYKDLSLYEPKE